MKTTPDRRQHPRVQMPGRMYASIGLSRRLRVVDLSSSGALIEHSQPLTPGQPCILDLDLGEGPVHVRAHVIWCQVYSVSTNLSREGRVRYRSGLQFSEQSPEAATRLRRYLTHRSASGVA